MDTTSDVRRLASVLAELKAERLLGSADLLKLAKETLYWSDVCRDVQDILQVTPAEVALFWRAFNFEVRLYFTDMDRRPESPIPFPGMALEIEGYHRRKKYASTDEVLSRIEPITVDLRTTLRVSLNFPDFWKSGHWNRERLEPFVRHLHQDAIGFLFYRHLSRASTTQVRGVLKKDIDAILDELGHAEKPEPEDKSGFKTLAESWDTFLELPDDPGPSTINDLTMFVNPLQSLRSYSLAYSEICYDLSEDPYHLDGFKLYRRFLRENTLTKREVQRSIVFATLVHRASGKKRPKTIWELERFLGGSPFAVLGSPPRMSRCDIGLHAFRLSFDRPDYAEEFKKLDRMDSYYEYLTLAWERNYSYFLEWLGFPPNLD